MSYGYTNSYLARIEYEAQARVQAQRERLSNDLHRDAYECTPIIERPLHAWQQVRMWLTNSLGRWLRAKQRRAFAKVP